MRRLGVVQTTTDDTRQRAKQYWLPTLCVGGPIKNCINVTQVVKEYYCNKRPHRRFVTLCGGKWIRPTLNPI